MVSKDQFSQIIIMIALLFGGVFTVDTFRQQQRADSGVEGVSAPDWTEWGKSAAPFVLAAVSWVVTNYLGGDKNSPLPFPLPNNVPQPIPPAPPSPPVPELEISSNLKVLQALDTLTSVLDKEAQAIVIDLDLTWGGKDFHIYFGPRVKA